MVFLHFRSQQSNPVGAQIMAPPQCPKELVGLRVAIDYVPLHEVEEERGKKKDS